MYVLAGENSYDVGCFFSEWSKSRRGKMRSVFSLNGVTEKGQNLRAYAFQFDISIQIIALEKVK